MYALDNATLHFLHYNRGYVFDVTITWSLYTAVYFPRTTAVVESDREQLMVGYIMISKMQTS